MKITSDHDLSMRIAAWEVKKERRAEEARAAIQRHVQSPNEGNQKAALVAIYSCSLAASSEHRLLTVLTLIEDAPPEIFWPAMICAFMALMPSNQPSATPNWHPVGSNLWK